MNMLAATCATVKQLPAEADDSELAVRLSQGDEQALEAIVARYGTRVTALAARLLDWSDGADDVAQDVFLSVLRKGNQFRGESSLWTWLATMTVNRCRSLRRRRWLTKRVLGAIVPVREQTAEPADRQTARDERAAAIRGAVTSLPTAHREVIVLRYFEELSLDEMAQILSLRRNTVEVRLSRARRQLEESLTEVLEK
jgi:RNA polymerase sigma-70 factor (ECF subfamily)